MTPLRRFAVLGDIHAEDHRLVVVLTWLKSQAIDAILSVGDLADGHGDLDRTCLFLRGHGVLGVRGNHDRWLVEDPFRHAEVDPATLAHLTELPPTLRLTTVAGDLLLCHGVGANDMVRLRVTVDRHTQPAEAALAVLLANPTLRFAVGGHTHQRMVKGFARQGGPPLTFINAGTLHSDYDSGFAVVDLERGLVDYHDLVEGPGSEITLRAAETLPIAP